MASILSAGTTTATGLNLSADTTGVLQLASNNGTVGLTMDTSQNVGIGTSSPGYKFHVANSSATSTTLLANILARLQSNASGADASLQFSDNVANSAGISLNQGALVFSIAGGSVGRFDTSGNLGIGVNNPTAKLQVAGQIRSTGVTGDYAAYFTQAGGADRDILVAGVSAVSNGLQVQYVSSAMKYTLTGLGSGTVSSSSGVLSASSDQNMKVADGEIENAINKVLALKPRYFYWKDKDGNADTAKRRQLGFYAQEVNVVVPEASPEPIEEHDGWGVYDRSLVATLTAAIQEQQALITQLQADVAALKGAA